MSLRAASAAFSLVLLTCAAVLPARAQRVYYRRPAPRVVVVRPVPRPVVVAPAPVVVVPARPMAVAAAPVVVVKPRPVVRRRPLVVRYH